MDKGVPSPLKIVTMALFALSCFGLLLFLWLSFGGPIPFKAQGYRVKVSFPFAGQLAQQADVRVAGVSIGKVINKELDPQGDRTLATLEIQRQYAPLHQDANAILRTKTILGETYVELTTGSPSAPVISDGGRLTRSRVQSAVQLDDVFSAFDPATRDAFRSWQQTIAVAVRGNDTNLSNVLGNLPVFVHDATDITRILDVEHQSVARLLNQGSVVFDALNHNSATLRSLITTGETTFAATAAQNNALAAAFKAFPAFLDESKLTSARLKTFSLDADPLFKQLIPAVQDLGPTLDSLRRLAPDLRHFFVQLGPLIEVSRTGLPATRDFLNGTTPVLAQLGPFLSQLNPILTWLSVHPQLISDFISNGATGTGAKDPALSYTGGVGHYLRQFGPTGSETLSFAQTRDKNNRGNTYPSPVWLADPNNLRTGMLGNWDCVNTGAPGDGSVSAIDSPLPGQSRPACRVDAPLGPFVGQAGKMAKIVARTYSRK